VRAMKREMLKPICFPEPTHAMQSKIPALLNSWIFRVANSYRIREEPAQGIVACAFAMTVFRHIQEILDEALSQVSQTSPESFRASLAEEVSRRFDTLCCRDLARMGYGDVVDLLANPLSEMCSVDIRQCRSAVDASLFLMLCRRSMVLSESVVDLAYSLECGRISQLRDRLVSDLACRNSTSRPNAGRSG